MAYLSEIRTMKRQLTHAGLTAMLVVSGLSAAPVLAQEAPPTVVIHGCVVTQDDGSVAIAVRGFGGIQRLRRAQLSPDSAVSPGEDVCGVIVATQDDGGIWTIQSVTASQPGAAGPWGAASSASEPADSPPSPPPFRPFRNR